MVLLVVKMVIAPLLVAGGSLAQRRWGEAIGGRIVGLPLTALPLLALMTIVEGPHFAATAARASQAGGVAQAAWCLAYAVAARRMRPAGALAVATAVFAALAFAVGQLDLSVWAAAAAAAAALLAGLAVWPSAGREPEPAALPAAWRWELPVRMVVASVFTFALSESASALGARSAGLVGAIPLLTVILAVATHAGCGPAAADRFLHGVLAASWSVIAALLALSLMLPLVAAPVAFAVAVLAALVAQVVAGRRVSRSSPEAVSVPAAGRAGARRCDGTPLPPVHAGPSRLASRISGPRARPWPGVARRPAASAPPHRDLRRGTPGRLPAVPR